LLHSPKGRAAPKGRCVSPRRTLARGELRPVGPGEDEQSIAGPALRAEATSSPNERRIYVYNIYASPQSGEATTSPTERRIFYPFTFLSLLYTALHFSFRVYQSKLRNTFTQNPFGPEGRGCTARRADQLFPSWAGKASKYGPSEEAWAALRRSEHLTYGAEDDLAFSRFI
jgi:hypothetical protein